MAFDLSNLGVKTNIPKVNFTSYSGVFQAPPKFGKTTMASLFPDSILLAFEKGYKAQVINFVDINKWEDFIEFIDKLEKHHKEIGDSVKTIVIDTVNEAYPMAEPYMCKREGRKDGKKYGKKQDIAYGQGWSLHDEYFKEQISRLYKLGYAVQYITHSETKTVTPKVGEAYDVVASTMPDRLAKIIYPEVDYIINGEHTTVTENGSTVQKRALNLQGSSDTKAGSRVFLDEMIIFDTEQEAMDKLQAVFSSTIEQKLREAGITDDIETIKAQQEQERIEERERAVSEKTAIDEDRNVELINAIQKNISNIEPAFIKSKLSAYNISSLADPSVVPTVCLEEILESANK